MRTETRMARLSDEEIEQELSGLEGWERDAKDFELAGRIDALA